MRQCSRQQRGTHQCSLLQAASCGLASKQSPASFHVPRLLAIIRRLGRCLQHLLVLLWHRQARPLGLSAADRCAQWGRSGRHWWCCCCCGRAVWFGSFGRHGVVVGFLSCLPRAPSAAVESFSKLADSIYFKHIPDVGPSPAHSGSTTPSSDSASRASGASTSAAAAAAGGDASGAAAGVGVRAAQDSVARPLASQDDSTAASQGDGPLPELWVNQLVSSSVRWRELRLVARQEAGGQCHSGHGFMQCCCGCWGTRDGGSCGRLTVRRRRVWCIARGSLRLPAGN